jgi:GntR family transcriptional repressor for pyruvate dehydrogenase complex
VTNMTTYQRIQSGRLYEQIVEQIEERILSGDLKPGDRLPTESELADQFGVSRTAVREAMKVLRHKGLADSHPGRGTFVADDTHLAMRHSLDLMVKIEKDGIENLVEVREILEPAIAALAAIRREEKHLAEMETAISLMDNASSDAEIYNQIDLNFHRTLAQATGNKLILALFDTIIDPLREQMRLTFSRQGKATHSKKFHIRLLEAIREQDANKAREAMEAHLKQIRESAQL